MNQQEVAAGLGRDNRLKILAWRRALGPVFLFFFCLLLSGCSRQEGRVLNAEDNSPIAGATIYHNGQVTQSDAAGHFKLAKVDLKKPMLVKAAGYRQVSVPLKRYVNPDARLTAFQAKAVYLSQAGVGASYLREPALQLIGSTDLNALVVDVKGERGLFSFSWEIPVGHKIGAFSKITIDDPDAFIREMHEKEIYVIARVCVFKDEAAGNNKKEWALHRSKSDLVYRDFDKIPWLDPFQEEVWDYALAMAKAAAEVGFDEIQFDYLRFPEGSAKYSRENTPATRTEVVTRFLEKARKELESYNVYLSMAVSGNALWKGGDANIGQDIAAIAPLVDYISPYVYPSDLPAKALNLETNSAAIPGKAVATALGMGIQRANNQAGKIRPWLQSFKDYSRLQKEFTAEEIGQEIEASVAAGTAGYILFNPENKYPYIASAIDRARLGPSATRRAALEEPEPQ